MNFTPDVKRGVPSRRMLPPIEVVEKEEESEDEGELIVSYSDSDDDN